MKGWVLPLSILFRLEMTFLLHLVLISLYDPHLGAPWRAGIHWKLFTHQVVPGALHGAWYRARDPSLTTPAAASSFLSLFL